MKIALASFIESSDATGMGKWTRRIGEQLRALGHEVLELDATSLELDPGSSLQRHLFGVTVARVLAREQRRVDVAVVHEPHALPACLVRKRTGTAVVVMSHGVENRIIEELHEATRHGAASTTAGQVLRHRVLWGWREAAAFRTADHVLCLAEADKRFVLESTRRDPLTVTCFVNGADPGPPLSDPGAMSRVLFIGTWIPEKGSRVLPALWHEVRAASPHAVLTVAGTGVAAEDVLRSFSPVDRESVRVVRAFHGREELRQLLASAGVFLLPSLREGSPLALLEAMAHGLPVVAASVGGVPDIVTQG